MACGFAALTWSNVRELEGYIERLQGAATQLMTENRRLRKYHAIFADKVRELWREFVTARSCSVPAHTYMLLPSCAGG